MAGGAGLTVALDATPLLGSRTGVGVAVDGFLRALARRPEVAVTGFGLTARGWRRLAAQLPPDVPARARPAPAAALLRVWERYDRPSGRWWTGSPQLVHGTNYVVPPGRRPARLVSVWDMTAVRYPEMCTPTSRRYPGLVARAVAAGAWVHTGSDYVKAEIVEHFAVAPERVLVVAPPVSGPPPGGTAAGRGPLGEARVSGPPYVLGLGRTEPRKDFPGLVRAFDIAAESQPDLQLRIAGPPGWGDAALAEAVASARHRDRIRLLGWVDDVPALLAGAAVFAYPSLYEGFGIPPLEAMAAGVPVVATAAGAVPEVAGDGALIVAPGDPEALAAAMVRALVDAGERSRLVAAGYRRLARFAPAITAEGLVSAYRLVAGA